MSMRRGFIVLVLFALGTVLFIFTIRNVGASQVADALLLLTSLEAIFVLVTIFLGLVIVGALKWRTVMKAVGLKMFSFRKIFLAKWVGHSISYLTPAVFFGGEPARFYVLKGEGDAPPSKIISSIIIDKLILFLISSVYFFIGIFSLLIYLDLSSLMKIISLALFSLIVITFWFLLRKARKISVKKGLFIFFIERFYLNKLKLIKKSKGKISEIEEEIVKFFKSPKKIILQIISLAILEVGLILLSCWLIIFFISRSLEIPELFAIKSIIDFSYTIPFPAGLGSLEISQAFVFQILGLGLAKGVAFSLILRGLNLIIAFMGLLIFVWMQVKFLGKRIINFFSRFSLENNITKDEKIY